MKVVKILGVVFGALFLLTGIGLLAGSAVVGAGQGEFDRQLAEQGLAGPVEGRVTGVDGTSFTVEYTDKQGNAQTGTGPVSGGTTAPTQGEEVSLYYSTVDPSQIVIMDFPGGDLDGISGILRTAGIVCLVLGALLLLAGIIGLVAGRKRAAVTAGPGGAYPPAQVPPPPPGAEQAPPPGAGQAYGQDPGQAYPPQDAGQANPPQPSPQQAPPQDAPYQAPPPDANRLG